VKAREMRCYRHVQTQDDGCNKKPVTILMMMHNSNGIVDKTSTKTGEPVRKPRPVLDYNKGTGGGGGGGQNGPAACILPSHEPLSERVQQLSL
jgi:hypothetical protein